MSAINAHKEVERHNGLDLLKDAISLPGLTMRYLMRNLDKSQGDFFTTFSSEHRDIAEQIEKHIRGGPSIVFRYQA